MPIAWPRRSASRAAAAAISPIRDTSPAQFLSANPDFCRSALARYTAADFIALVQRHRIAFHEKHKGQLFCDDGSEQIIAMLLRECEAGRVERWQPCEVTAVRHGEAGYELDTGRGTVRAAQIVVATGGLSIPKIGASDFGYRLARQFGHRIVETRPALVPLTFGAETWGADGGAGRPVAAGARAHWQRARAGRVRRGPAVHAPGPVRSGGAADLELLATRAGPANRPVRRPRPGRRAARHQGRQRAPGRHRARPTAARPPGRTLAGSPSRPRRPAVARGPRPRPARPRPGPAGLGPASGPAPRAIARRR